MAPSEIRLSEDRKQLEIEWLDGSCSRLAASHLRANSRSAGARRSTLDGTGTKPADDLHIAGLHLVGNYAINLVFSDGHDRGIYPWSYLRVLDGTGADSR